MTRKQKCGHKAGPDCIICNDSADLGHLDMSQHASLVYRLIDLAPRILAAAFMDPTGYAASSIFIDALDIPPGVRPDDGVVNRLAKLAVIAANTAAQMVRLVDKRDEMTFTARADWRPGQLLSTQMMVAAANNNPSMVADLMVAGIAGKEPMDQLDVLSEVLYHNILLGWRARETAKAQAKTRTS